MSLRKSVISIKQRNRSFHQQKIRNQIAHPAPLDAKLIANPFLKDDEKYQYLLHKMKQFSITCTNNQKNDSYHFMVQDKLRSLLITIGALLTRDIQKQKLQETYEWFLQQQKLIQQRKSQGDIRYKVTKQYLIEKNQQCSPQFRKMNYKSVDYKSLLQSEIVTQQALPFQKQWRTTHKQLQTADVRLKQYNRKNLNFDTVNYMSAKKSSQLPRIHYPKMGKLKYTKQYEVQQQALAQQIDANKIGQNANNPQNPEIGQNQIKQGDKAPPQQIKPEQQQQQAQDLGLGQQPAQPQQQEQQQQQQDKLAPRLKSYIWQHKPQLQKQKYASTKRMNDRYLKVQNDFIKKQNQDSQLVQMMHQWAARKTQLDKQIIKRIQNMGINYDKYKLSYQDPQKQQIFSTQDAKKYGLSKTFDLRANKGHEVSFIQGLQLPNIKNKSQLYQKSLRKDKLNTLKKKFGKMLNLKDYEQRQVSQSICQVKQQRKGFSQILRKHSKSKQRIKQLDQAVELKQKLARQKISIDITALSKSLCLYQEQQNLQDGTFPAKNLLQNPFWVEPAKKKKKK